MAECSVKKYSVAPDVIGFRYKVAGPGSEATERAECKCAAKCWKGLKECVRSVEVIDYRRRGELGGYIIGKLHICW
ncbi:hypothetical protein J6590_016336 [Homalodisca vitripennis]|nr:hypothetical protein J6590_016336 [Homalodisca vitripennis]